MLCMFSTSVANWSGTADPYKGSPTVTLAYRAYVQAMTWHDYPMFLDYLSYTIVTWVESAGLLHDNLGHDAVSSKYVG